MPTSPRKSLVTLATYNEIENLPKLVDEIFATVPDVDLLVIDDNSPDGTGRWCDEQAARDSRLRCRHRPKKLGLGTATLAGLRYAIAHDYAYVLNMDADFSHHPCYLPDLLQGMEQDGGSAKSGQPSVDVMIGSRYVPGGGIQGWPLKRHLMSRAVNLYARCLLGLKTRDCSGALRCYRVERLKQLDLDAVRSRGYCFQEEILWHLKRQGAGFAETPIIFTDRTRGQSKCGPGEALAALWTIFRLGITNWIGL